MEISSERIENGNTEKEKEIPEEEGEQKEKEKTKLKMKKIKIFASVIYGNLFLGSCYSLMAPIFPAEAERKGASPTVYGFVFGVYQLVMFLASPIYGKIIPKLKPGFVMKTGMLVSGICVITFGFLDHASSGTTFIALAIIIRAIDALGASAFLTASYTTLGVELPEDIGKAMSAVETAFALGLAGGPVLGGFLYELGGFSLPFIVVGTLLLAGTAVNCVLFNEDKEVERENVNVMKLLKNIDFCIDILTISTSFVVIGFNEATLEPHIRQFSLSPTITGVIFLIGGLTDAVISPLWGVIAEKLNNCQYLTCVGALLLVFCFMIVGPVSFLNFPTNLWVVIFSQFLLGLGMAAEIVCSFTHGMKHNVQRGFPNNVGTYSLVSGVLFSSGCLGAFIGPSLGGYLIDKIGYVHATEAVVFLKVTVAFICASRLLFLFFKKGNGKKNEEPATVINQEEKCRF